MSIDVDGLVNAVASHAFSTGYYEQVNTHGVRAVPGEGMRAAVWLENMRPVRSSGLASTSLLVTLTLRQYQSAYLEPQDMIDPDMLRAASALFEAYSGDFTLGGLVRNIDLLGAYGQALEAIAGYLEIANFMIRVLDITIPIVVNDTFTQSP